MGRLRCEKVATDTTLLTVPEHSPVLNRYHRICGSNLATNDEILSFSVLIIQNEMN